MRISRFYKLGRTQATLDFVDVDAVKDTRVFLNPSALAQLPSPWGEECVYLIQNFFNRVLALIKDGEDRAAETLLRHLREPRETRLGLSRASSDGRALGESSAHDVWRALSKSDAAKTGLLSDLEDTVLFVRNVGIDKISDITTVLIRSPLIKYTQDQAQLHQIPLKKGVALGPIWDPQQGRWSQPYVDLPIVKGTPLLLVPKGVVRRHLDYDPDDYYRNFLLEHLKGVELEAKLKSRKTVEERRQEGH